jgi:hypothetical protein
VTAPGRRAASPSMALTSQGKRWAFPRWLRNIDDFRLWWATSPRNFALRDNKVFTTFSLVVIPLEGYL